jgi:hypothetical protein
MEQRMEQQNLST